jgi:hypothetical protein
MTPQQPPNHRTGDIGPLGSLSYLTPGWVSHYPRVRPPEFDGIPDPTIEILRRYYTPEQWDGTDRLALGRVSFKNVIDAELEQSQVDAADLDNLWHELCDARCDAQRVSRTGQRAQENMCLEALYNVLYGNRRRGMVEACLARRASWRIDNTGGPENAERLSMIDKLKARAAGALRAGSVILVGHMLAGTRRDIGARRRTPALHLSRVIIGEARPAPQP